MKIKQLVDELLQLNQDLEVCIGDYKKNGYLASADEPCGEGIYPDFKVEIMKGDFIPDGHNEWVSLSFDSKFGEE